MNYKIAVLAENNVYGRGLQGEHRFSLLVEAREHKALFDTGASNLFIRNARLMGVDLTGVEFIILSHGRRNHTGGLHAFLKMNSRAKMICKQEVFRREFKDERGNGMLHPRALGKFRFWLIDRTTEIVPGIFAFPDVRIVDRSDTRFEHFLVEVGDEMRPDTFEDGLALMLKSEKSLSVLGVCSRREIANTIHTVQTAFPRLRPKLVMGGFHIHNAGIEKFNVISAFLGMKLPECLGVCHYTSVGKYALFHQQFNDRVFYNYVGWVETV